MTRNELVTVLTYETTNHCSPKMQDRWTSIPGLHIEPFQMYSDILISESRIENSYAFSSSAITTNFFFSCCVKGLTRSRLTLKSSEPGPQSPLVDQTLK